MYKYDVSKNLLRYLELLYNRNLARGNSGLRRLDPSLLESGTEGPVVTSRGLGPGPEGPSCSIFRSLVDMYKLDSTTL